MSYFQALILAIVEGITEFLPISSTGHMIITEAFVKTTNAEFTKLFIVNIQFGAILSVIVLYWKRFFQSFDFYKKLFIAFIPAAIIGFLLNDYIDQLLESVLVVAISLVVGGVFLLFVDNIFNKNETEPQKELSIKSSFIIGFFQVIAMIPGVSRSAATIVGGLSQKLNRKNAAEFSFFLAVPTMAAASGYKLLKAYEIITVQDVKVLLFGNVIAFIVALLAIKTFIGFVSKYGFKLFGYYRIALGLILIISILLGYNFTIY